MAGDSPFPLMQYGYAVLGILISVILPILRSLLPKPPQLLGVQPKPSVYLLVGAFSLLTALLVVAFGGKEASSWYWYNALLAGYAWDSTLQKITHG